MKTTPPPIMHPAVYLTNAELHQLLNEPIEPADPPAHWSDVIVWAGVWLISCSLIIAVICWLCR